MVIQFTDIKQALRNRDPDLILDILPDYLTQSPEHWDRVLQQMVFLSAGEEITNNFPKGIVYLDAVRDLATLYEGSNSEKLTDLLRFAVKGFCCLNIHLQDQSLTQIKPEFFSEPVFTRDITQYIRSGDQEKALEESAKLLIMMDNPMYLVEILASLAADYREYDGYPLVIAGTVMKSVDYVNSFQRNALVYFLTEYLCYLHLKNKPSLSKSQLSREKFSVIPYFRSVLTEQEVKPRKLLYLVYAQQLWESARMKESEIQSGIQWYLEQHYTLSKTTLEMKQEYEQVEPEELIKALHDRNQTDVRSCALGYLQHGGAAGELFRAILKLFLERSDPQDTESLITLNAYRTAAASLKSPLRDEAIVRAAELLSAD